MEAKKNVLQRGASSKCLGCSAKNATEKTNCSKSPKLEASSAKQTRESPPAIPSVGNTMTSEVVDKESLILRSIVADNSKYFIAKSKVCCSVKPSDLKLQLPTTTGHTMYMHDFIKKHPTDGSVKIDKMEPYRAKYPFMDQTNYKSNFVTHPVAPAKRIEKQIHIDENAPRFLQTQYSGQFKNWGGKSQNFKIEPQENNLFGGGVFDGKTMYRSEFVPKTSSTRGSPMAAASHTKYPTHQLSPLFLDMNIPLTSNYRNEFTHKHGSMEKNCKPKNVYVPSVGNEATFNTEYKKMFDPKEASHCHYRKVMSVKELQDLISRK